MTNPRAILLCLSSIWEWHQYPTNDMGRQLYGGKDVTRLTSWEVERWITRSLSPVLPESRLSKVQDFC